MRNGFPCVFNSATVCSSAGTKFSLAISPKLPSVVITRPIVECSWITFSVPAFAASWKGIALENQGVFTILSLPSSTFPPASFTRKPTQSISRTFAFLSSPRSTDTASFGINLGSTVVIIFPEPLNGSWSLTSFCIFSSIPGKATSSINLRINVDFPVRTGPTTPMYISPPVLACISR